MKINYGIIAVTIDEEDAGFGKILHFCGYENKPTTEDFEGLEIELNTDKEFGLVGKMGKSVFLVEAPKEIVKNFAECIKVPKERKWHDD